MRSHHPPSLSRLPACPLLQGAGLTETCAATFVDYPNEPDHFASVGPPGPAFWMRLEVGEHRLQPCRRAAAARCRGRGVRSRLLLLGPMGAAGLPLPLLLE